MCAAVLSIGSFALAPPVAIAASKVHATSLDATKLQTLDDVSAYINGINTMQGEFVQVGPDGGRTEGYFVVKRPGRILFRYKKPVLLEIIADGKDLVVRDRKLGTQDFYPIYKTPMRFLLKKGINLRKDSKVLDVVSGDELLTVTIEETTPVGTGRIAIIFDRTNMDIKQWTVTDPQGLDTTVALYNVEFGKPTDPKWFRINRTRN